MASDADGAAGPVPGHPEPPPAPAPLLPTRTLVWRGARRRCPRCGAGHLFTRWMRMVDRCPRCGLLFEREEGFMLGVMALNMVIVSILFVAYLVPAFVVTSPDPPLLPLTLGAAAICAIGPFLVYPWAKTLWLAVDLAMRPVEAIEDAEALTYLASRRSSGEVDPSK